MTASDKKKLMNSNKKQTYTAVIIGAGKISSGFDSPASLSVLTHAHALANAKRLRLVGISDINKKTGTKEAKKWRTNFYLDTERMLLETHSDVIVIATPDETHAEMLLLALAHKPRLVICEKPVVSNEKEMKSLIKKLERNQIPVLVNFSRRFDPVVVHLRKELITGKYGKILSANAVYTKGILHNGSHALDLARYLFGEMRSSKGVFQVGDFSHGAPSIGGIATFERCPQFYLMNGDARSYALFEFEIFTEKKRIAFVNEGVTIITQDVVSDPVYKGFRMLGKSSTKQTGLVDAMTALHAHAVGVLDGKELPISSLSDGLRTQEACFSFLKTVNSKK